MRLPPLDFLSLYLFAVKMSKVIADHCEDAQIENVKFVQIVDCSIKSRWSILKKSKQKEFLYENITSDGHQPDLPGEQGVP
jgi:hypothetical protein